MGRLSKFSFPIPGRKTRPAAEPQQPEVYAPKAQKLLGNSAINVESQWDAKSTSGMSIAVSESTTAHHPTDRAPGSRGGAKARSQWGDESEIVPPQFKRAAPGPTAYNPRTESHYEPSDVSSLRKRQSSSTIMSYYDKSRVPLSVSQQTSASAMAKGYSSKATSLLDMDNTMSPPPAPKPKPAKRDISNMFSRPRTGGSNKSAPGRDFTPDPLPAHPLAHKSSHATLTSIKTERDVPRKTTRERLQEFTGRGPPRNPPRNPPPQVPVQKMTRREATDLNNLYDHYEQMSFKQVMGDEEIPPDSEEELDQEHPARESGIPGLPQSDQCDSDKPIAPGPPPDIEYATSISSRHTRTSKASKKTTPSFIESDLQLQSVLSLSSDSEDDGYAQQPKPSPRPVRSRNGAADEELPLSERRRSTASKSSANSGKSGKSIRASLTSKNAYLTIPTEPLPPCPPDVARRTSSLAHRPSNATAPSLRSSRVSVLSTSTAGSASRHLQDARMAPMSPGQHQNGEGRRSETPVPRRRGSIRSADEHARPLSPRSAERRAAEQDPMNPRFMAVSRQEEMLLSALRMKRARMRGNPLGELEEEDYMEDLPEVSSANGNPQEQGAYAAPVRAMQRKGSVSTARNDTRLSPHSAPRPAGTRNVTSPAPAPHTSPATVKRQLSLQTEQRKPPSTFGSMLHLDEDSEPSPDLSDFMDLDNGSEGTDGSSRGREKTGDKTPVTPKDAVPEVSLEPKKPEGLRVVTEEAGVPRPDSPISPQLPVFPAPGGTRKGVRLSAVGGVAGMEASWWGDDG